MTSLLGWVKDITAPRGRTKRYCHMCGRKMIVDANQDITYCPSYMSVEVKDDMVRLGSRTVKPHTWFKGKPYSNK